MSKPVISTIGELKKSGYTSKSIKEELRDNLIQSLRDGIQVFDGILGYEFSVIPEVQTAILAGHNINFLGLRGQAKTKLARMITRLLDEWTPVVFGSELNDDPLNPLSKYALNLIAENGDETPIEWMHRSDRYVEKLATPDVTVADLIGDLDPIKAANLRVGYQDERAIHFGLIPRSNRCIFVINELPDLQARIQVSLFNILQEGDIQIRGFKLRLPLDIQFIFTANPEDYTNRGSIVTPLKDRIGSQILTHYPEDKLIAASITASEAKLSDSQKREIEIPVSMRNMIENISFLARKSEFVDQKSGVSARLGISILEAVVAAAERRKIIHGEKNTTLRVGDLYHAIQAINGKIEMVYEGEQEGPYNVAVNLIIQSIREEFDQIFGGISKIKMRKIGETDQYSQIIRWFEEGNFLQLLRDDSDLSYHKTLEQVEGLKKILPAGEKDNYFLMDLALHGLAANSRISNTQISGTFHFGDLVNSMMKMTSEEDDEESFS
ncbi:MAG: magnesium chelatase [Bacteroidetes bacterium]|nr:magnesium chelatase [Bacteroidota bacterium]